MSLPHVRVGAGIAPAVVLGLIASCVPMMAAAGSMPVYAQYKATLRAQNPANPSRFLTGPTAISGRTLIVGGVVKHGVVAAFVFTEPASGWHNVKPVAVLTAKTGTNGGETQPEVAISGRTIVVGAPSSTNAGGSGRGTADVFTEPHGGWKTTTQPSAVLTASDEQRNDFFGVDVAIDHNTIIVGSFGHNGNRGTCYVYVKPKTGWANATQTAELTPSEAASDARASTVAISGNTIVLSGGSPVAYVFAKPKTGWANGTETRMLEYEPTDTSGGTSLAFDDATVVIGNWTATVSVAGQGAAYVFVRPTSGWGGLSPLNPNATLTAPDPGENEGFGTSVAVSGTKVVVGDDGRDVGSNVNQGAVFVWDSRGHGWEVTPTPYEVTATDGRAQDLFGSSVAARGSFLAINADGRDATYLLVPPRPRLRSLAQTPGSWHAGHRLPKPNPAVAPKGGTMYSFGLSKPATVRFDFAQRLPGRRSHGRCVAESAANRHRTHCVRYGAGHSFRVSLPAGHDTVWFDGRISASKELATGRYRVMVTATASGSTSRPETLHFTLVKS